MDLYIKKILNMNISTSTVRNKKWSVKNNSQSNFQEPGSKSCMAQFYLNFRLSHSSILRVSLYYLSILQYITYML